MVGVNSPSTVLDANNGHNCSGSFELERAPAASAVGEFTDVRSSTKVTGLLTPAFPRTFRDTLLNMQIMAVLMPWSCQMTILAALAAPTRSVVVDIPQLMRCTALAHSAPETTTTFI